MLAGKLDRSITIEQRIEVREGTYNTVESEAWVPVCTVFANVMDMLPSRAERIADGIDVSQRPCRVRIRWRSDIDGAMRINFGGRLMRIVSGPAEMGRREGLELVCEDMSSEGVQP